MQSLRLSPILSVIILITFNFFFRNNTTKKNFDTNLFIQIVNFSWETRLLFFVYGLFIKCVFVQNSINTDQRRCSGMFLTRILNAKDFSRKKPPNRVFECCLVYFGVAERRHSVFVSILKLEMVLHVNGHWYYSSAEVGLPVITFFCSQQNKKYQMKENIWRLIPTLLCLLS